MFKNFKIPALVLPVLSILTISLNAYAQLTGRLTIEIDGLRNTNGQVCLRLFNSSQGFPNNGSILKKCVKIPEDNSPENPLIIPLDGISSGSYAVAVYHDEKGDGIFHKDDFGRPLQGFGFSQNPPVKTSAPAFGDAVVLVAGEETAIKISIKYKLD